MNKSQWMAVITVFGGLTITATDSLQLGHSVMKGLFLVTFGSALHALTYIASEVVMTTTTTTNDTTTAILTVEQNCAVQSTTGATVFFLWQLLYTLPNYDKVLKVPMEQSGTTVLMGIIILCLFGITNLIHSLAFYHTLAYFPGGATSAGVMKGFQAVLVFVVTHLAFCGKTGGEEMCFSTTKWIALIIVTGGVIWYGKATTRTTTETGRRIRTSSSRIDADDVYYEQIHHEDSSLLLPTRHHYQQHEGDGES